MEPGILIANFVYAVFGVILTLIFMLLGFKIFDRVTPFDTSKQLSDNNIAVGIVVGWPDKVSDFQPRRFADPQ